MIASLQNRNDFVPTQHQLSAFGELMQQLQQLPKSQSSALSNIEVRLQSTTIFCENVGLVVLKSLGWEHPSAVR